MKVYLYFAFKSIEQSGIFACYTKSPFFKKGLDCLGIFGLFDLIKTKKYSEIANEVIRSNTHSNKHRFESPGT